ncbi:hypothetical protein M4I32_04030 [Microbacterium sp. LRZ72]|uniref:4'-phosphopantetheinyl transferase family protein n=1 Tax=Microbacterium sp. LRZ72 TaxID=2942481 RepID=UPI0029BE2FD8|nr:hypothetical protein [Microbacterium sp. LRZ72]MDX2375964.1 hypothetical protein [Microbacterium sp. LRZ72]
MASAPERDAHLRVGPVAIAWRTGTDRAARRPTAERLLRRLAGAGATADVTRDCPRCGEGDHGAPRLVGAPVRCSISHAGDVTVVAVAPSGRCGAIGIDAELSTPGVRDPAGLARALGTTGSADLARWTRVEAALKARGSGLALDPRCVRLHRRLGRTLALVTPPEGAVERFVVRAVHGIPGCTVSLAIASSVERRQLLAVQPPLEQ